MIVLVNGSRSLALIWLVDYNYSKSFLLRLDLSLQEVAIDLPVLLSAHLVSADEHAHHIPDLLLVFYFLIGQKVQ